MNPTMIGILSHPLLFGVAYVVSLLPGGERPELAGLTIWNLRQLAGSKARAAQVSR